MNQGEVSISVPFGSVMNSQIFSTTGPVIQMYEMCIRDSYQAQYQVRFSTYAVPLIMGEIRRFMRDDGAVKVARPLKELYAKAMKYARQYAADTGREPTIGEIAQALCSTPEEVSMSMEAARKPASLQAPLSDEAGKLLSLEDCLGATAEESDKAIDRVLLRELDVYKRQR